MSPNACAGCCFSKYTEKLTREPYRFAYESGWPTQKWKAEVQSGEIELVKARPATTKYTEALELAYPRN
jgi:hypothetical protein